MRTDEDRLWGFERPARRAGLVLLAAAAAVVGCRTPAPQAPDPPAGRLTAAPATRPYPAFDGNSFEPSAVAYDAAAGRCLVLNDRDPLLYQYALADGERGGPPSLRLERTCPIVVSAGGANGPGTGVRAASKFESLAPLGGSGAYLAATSFDRVPADAAAEPPATDAAFNRVVWFRPPAAADAPVTRAAEVRVDLAGLAGAVRARSQVPGFQVEGLAADAEAGVVLFGVRQVFERFDRARNVRVGERDVAYVVRGRYSQSDLAIGGPFELFEFTTNALGEAQGLSDLQYDPATDAYLVLTSREVKDAAGRVVMAADSHGGALFRVGAAALRGRAGGAAADLGRPIRRFRAKPEGLTLLPGGRALVVFDDDRDWKRLFADYPQGQGQFEVFALAPAAAADRGGPPGGAE